ncbi:MAG TPA: CHAT domain-containing protein [Longimicrobium sp.]|nr:CHAT domain-containing protein [Longimicrobium sp.]
MMSKTAVLVLAANPKDTPTLRLDHEVREIQSGLLRNRGRAFQIRHDWAVRPRDVRRALLEHRPRIVHFCGHGSQEEGLVLEDEVGGSKTVSISAIAGLFALFSDHVKCVVLNACYSEAQARAIAQYVECVVGMNHAIADKAAVEFSIGFYDAISAGEAYDAAFRFGCNAIELAGLPGNGTPVLILREASFPPAAAEPRPPEPPLEPTRSASDGLSIKTLRSLNASGWSTANIMKRLEQLDYENVAGLDDLSGGSFAEWERIAENNPDGYAFLVDGRNEIVGYWHFEALPSDMIARAEEGELEDGEITVEKITLLCAPGVLDINFIIFVVEKRHRGFRANRLLLEAFLDRLEDLVSAGIHIRSVYANAFTPEGVGMCKSLGMRYLRPHKRIGLMFRLEIRDSEILARSRPRLAAAMTAL